MRFYSEEGQLTYNFTIKEDNNMGGRGGSSGKGSSGGGSSTGGVDKSFYESLPTQTVRLRDKWGDYTGEEHTGRVGKDGQLVSVKKGGEEWQVGLRDKWSIEMGDVSRGFVAVKHVDSEREAYKVAKRALGY